MNEVNEFEWIVKEVNKSMNEVNRFVINRLSE